MSSKSNQLSKNINNLAVDFHKRLRQVARYVDDMSYDSLLEMMANLEVVKENIEYLEGVTIKKIGESGD